MKSGWIIVWLLSACQVPLFKCIHPGLSLRLFISTHNYTAEAWEGDPCSVAEGEKPTISCLKIQLNYDFRSLSQTHNAYHRRSALLWFVLVFAASRTLMETFIFECPTDFPPKSRWEPLRPERSTGSLGLMVIQAERDREEQRGTERILILTKLTHLGLRSGSRSLVPLCETVKNEQLFAHREGPYLTLFSPSCHLPWNENLSIKTEKSVLEIDAPVHPAAWSVAVCIKVRRWCLSLSSWKSRTQTTSFSERWLEGILGT